MAQEWKFLLKVIVIGDKKVGKKTLVIQLKEPRRLRALKVSLKELDKKIDEDRVFKEKTKSQFKKRIFRKKIEKLIEKKRELEQRPAIESSTLPTTGVDFGVKIVKFRNEYVKLQIWVLSSHERFQTFSHMYVASSQAAIIIYDITNRDSLNRISEWCQLIRELNGIIPIILVGNKLDLKELREVSIEQGIGVKEKLQISDFLELSVKNSEDIEAMFEKLTHHISTNFSRDIKEVF